MLSKEFLSERGNQGSFDGGEVPASSAPAQTPDWLKNIGSSIANSSLGNAVSTAKNAVFKTPVSLDAGPADAAEKAAAASGYTGIDPIQRQRAGMAPATQQEINRYMKANPAVVGGLTDRNGNPIASGGAQEVEKAARAAAPRRGADFDADAEVGAVDPAVIGNRFKTPNELGFQPGGSTAPTAAAAPAAPSSVNTGGAGGVGGGGQAPGVEARPVPSSTIKANEIPAVKAFSEPAAGAAPTPMKGGYGSGVDNPSVAPKATDPAAQYAAADAGRAAIKSSETNPELERMKTNAGLKPSDVNTGGAGGVGGGGQAAAPFAGQTDEFGGMESPAAAQSANDGDAGEDLAKIRANAGLAQSANDGDAGEAQAAAAVAPKPAVAAAPEVPAPAQAAEPAPAPVKAFVQPEAPAAPTAPAAPAAVGQSAASMAGAMRSTGQAAPKPAAKSDPAVLKQQQDLIAKGAKIKADGVMGPATQAAIKQFAAAPAASRSTAPAAPAAPAKPAVRESQEINRMRFLAGLTKD